MTQVKRQPQVSSHSQLLSNEENSNLNKILGSRCPSLATAVVQIYMSDSASGHAKWNKRSCGVVCLVKDNPKRSYFIRVLDMDRKVVVFDQEIYNQFRYRSPRPYFHTFEAEDGQIGLNFADENEAANFQMSIENKLTERRLRRERRMASKRQSLNGLQAPVPAGPPSQQQSNPPMPQPVQQVHVPAHVYFNRWKKEKERKAPQRRHQFAYKFSTH